MSVKCLIYCSKAKPYLYKTNFVKIEDIKKGIWDKLVYEVDNNERLYLNGEKKEKLNGKIVASFDCEKVEEFTTDYRGNKEQNKRIMIDSCVPLGDLVDYQKGNHLLYAIHISNLEIFDKPKELSDFVYLTCGHDLCSKCKYYDIWASCCPNEIPLEKAPQNMMSVWERKNTFNLETYERRKSQYVLISIRPEWVCKILNGEKTIEVRKQVVKALKELI